MPRRAATPEQGRGVPGQMVHVEQVRPDSVQQRRKSAASRRSWRALRDSGSRWVKLFTTSRTRTPPSYDLQRLPELAGPGSAMRA